MDDTREPAGSADPRQSIAAFVDAARREGLLSDSDAAALQAFHQRLISPPPGVTPAEKTVAAALARDLEAAHKRLPAGGPRRATQLAIEATRRAVEEDDPKRLAEVLEEASRVLDAARQRIAAAELQPDPVQTTPSISSAERREARTILAELGSRRMTYPEAERRPITAVMGRLARVIDRGPPDELHAAVTEGRQLLDHLRGEQKSAAPAPPTATAPQADPQRRAAQELLFKLKGRYQRAPRRERDRLGVAIRSLSKALSGNSKPDLNAAMRNAVELLDIRPAAPDLSRSATTTSPRPDTPAKAGSRPTPPAPPAPQPGPAPAATVAKATSAPAPAATPRPPRPKRTGPSPFARWAGRLKKGSGRIWSRVTADVAAHTLTYLGVLLSIAVVYVFYVYDYFGRYVEAQYRPLWFIGTVLFFLGMARTLRRGTGIPSTATAVEMIGLLAIPMMSSGFFRDGCDPGVHLTCMIPDVQGPGRWIAYAAVGFITAGIYYLFAGRRHIYSYLVAPMLWMAVGAAGLYLEDGLGIVFGSDAATMDTFVHDGISSWQLIAVLGAIALTIAVAGRYRGTTVGKVIAVPSVRAAVIVSPFVLAVSFVFGYFNDTLEGARATFDDVGASNMAALLAVGAVFAFGSRASFAWEGVSAKIQRESASIMRSAAFLAVGAAWVMSAAYEISPAWVGFGLMVYSVAVLMIDRAAGGTGSTALWIARLSGAAGAVLALLEPLPTAIGWGALALPAILVGKSAAVDRAFDRLVPAPSHEIDRRLRLWIPLFVAVGNGGARLAWPDASSWVLVAAAGAFAASRLATSTAAVASLSRFPAAASAVAALALQAGLQTTNDAMGGYEFGGLLFALGLVAALIDIPWGVRLPATTGLLAAGTSVILREAIVSTARDAAWVDTAALAAFGLALVAGLLLQGTRRGVVLQGALGHLFILSALGRSLAFEQTALLGLSVVAIAYGAEAVAIELDRPGFFRRLSSHAGGSRRLVEVLPTLVVTVVMIPIAVLAGRHVPFIRAERARFGPVLSAVSWVYLGAAWLRRARVEHIVVPFSYAAAAAAVAVAFPSTTAILTTTWSATAVTALLALALKRPYATAPSWGLGVAATVVTAVRLGVDRGDAHLVLHAAALALLLVPAAFNLRVGRPAGLPNAWLRPPAAIGMLLTPATMALAISDSRYLAAVALAAAAAYTVLGWATRTGGVSIPVTFSIAVAYAHLLFENEWAHPFDEPIVWMPLAAVFVATSIGLPGRHSWRLLDDAAPGSFLAGLTIGGLAVVMSFAAGVTDIALASFAGILLIAFLVRRHDAWLAASVVSLAASGFIAGDHWPPVVAAAAAIASGIRSDHFADSPIGTALQWISAAWWAAAFGLLGAWQGWTAGELVGAASIAGGAILAGGLVLSVTARLPARARRWSMPLHGLGQFAAATVVVASGNAFDVSDAYGTLAGVAIAEASVAAAIGSVRRNQTLIAAAGVLAAAAYGFTAVWQDWSAPTLTASTAGLGAVLLVLWTVAYLARPGSDRVRMWALVAGTGGQAAAVATLVTAWSSFEAPPAAGVTAGVVAYQALGIGLIATVRRISGAVRVAGALVTVAYGFHVVWLEMTATTFITVTSAVGAFLLAAWTLSQFATSVSERLRLWLDPIGIGAQIALASVVTAAWLGLGTASASGVTAGVLAAESLVAGVIGTLGRNPALIAASTALAAGSYSFTVAWREWATPTFVGVTAAVAVFLVTAWTAAQFTGRLAEKARMWVPVTGVAGQVAAGAAVIGAWAGLEVVDAAGVTALFLAGEATITGLLGTARRNVALVETSTMLATAAFALTAVWGDWTAPVVVGVTAATGGVALVAWIGAIVKPLRSARAQLWVPGLAVVSQLAAITVVAMAALEFGETRFAGVVAATAAVEAVAAAIIATRRGIPVLAWPTAGLTAIAYGATMKWLEWSDATVTGATAAVGAILVVAHTFGYLTGVSSPRMAMWLRPSGVLSQLAAAAVIGSAWASFSTESALGITAGVAAVDGLTVGWMATARRNRALAWISSTLAIAAYGLLAGWLTWTAPTVITATSVLAAAGLVFWELDLLRETVPARIRIWAQPAGAAGLVGAVAVVAIAGSELSLSAANGVTSGVLWFATVMTAVIATSRTDGILAATATTLAAVAYGFGAGWLQWDARTFIAVTGPIGAALLVMTTAAYLTGTGPGRLRLWLPSLATAGHAALIAAIAVGLAEFDSSDAAAVIAGSAAFESVVLGVVGAARRNRAAVVASTTLAAIAYWSTTVAADLDGSALVALTGAVSAAAAAAGTVLTRYAAPGSHPALWALPIHGLAAAGVATTSVLSGTEITSTGSLVAMAVVAAGAGTYAAVNARYTSDEWGLHMAAALAYLVSASLLMAWSVRADSAQTGVVFGIAAAGLGAAAWFSANGIDPRWKPPLAATGIGLEVIALTGAFTEFGPNSSESAAAMLIAGAALATHGLLARRLRAVEAALVIWLLAGLLLIDEQLTLTLHGAIALVSVTLLTVLEIERQRRRSEGLRPLEVLARTEWVLMIAPMSMAAYSMGDHLWYALVLFVEGLLLTGWGAATRIRRRAFIGFGGAVMAVLLSIAIPAVQEARGGGQGTWLVIAAIAAVVFIVVGSTIERKRVVIGQRLQQLGEILEDWE